MLLVTIAFCATHVPFVHDAFRAGDLHVCSSSAAVAESAQDVADELVTAEAALCATPRLVAVLDADAPVGELARIDTPDGLRLEATFYPVPRAKDPLPAVLLVHDLGSDRSQLVPLVERLLKDKLCVLAIDLRGHGTSATTELDWSKLDEEGRARVAPFMAHDVNAAMQWLQAETRVLGARQSIVGQGFGALLALRAAARDERVTSLTMIEPARDMHGFLIKTLLPEADGLATQLVIGKDEAEPFELLITEGELDFVELRTVKAARGELLADKRLPGTLSKWVDSHRDGPKSPGMRPPRK